MLAVLGAAAWAAGRAAPSWHPPWCKPLAVDLQLLALVHITSIAFTFLPLTQIRCLCRQAGGRQAAPAGARARGAVHQAPAWRAAGRGGAGR